MTEQRPLSGTVDAVEPSPWLGAFVFLHCKELAGLISFWLEAFCQKEAGLQKQISC